LSASGASSKASLAALALLDPSHGATLGDGDGVSRIGEDDDARLPFELRASSPRPSPPPSPFAVILANTGAPSSWAGLGRAIDDHDSCVCLVEAALLDGVAAAPTTIASGFSAIAWLKPEACPRSALAVVAIGPSEDRHP
jgi:hypothetical protein